MEKLTLRDFDITGIITLNDIEGIEKYVTPVKENGKVVNHLSRSKEYYNVKNMTELALEREELKTKLTRELSKRNFVILENMLNCSAKVYFKKLEQYISNGKDIKSEIQLQQAEECLMEDVKNILVILQEKGLIEVDYRKRLPAGEENSTKRAIEMDNKAMLYVFAKTLKIKKEPEDIEILTPGYGSLYIGPFFKAMYGYNYTNVLKSKYIEDSKCLEETDVSSLMSSDRIFERDKKVLLLDDNVGTGTTMLELKSQLKGKNVVPIASGAVQYNWRNYYRVSIGDKKDIDRFEVDDFDIVTPFNYAGHKLYKRAIDMLHSSGEEYIKYLKSKSYRKDEYCDLKGAINRSLISAQKTNLKLVDDIEIDDDKTEENIPVLEQYKDGPTEVNNPISKKIIKNLIDVVISIDKPEKTKKELEGISVE